MIRGLLLLLLAAVPLAFYGQVVNIENKRFADDTSRWSGQGGFRYHLTENTQRSISLGANISVQYIQEVHRVFFISDLTVDRVEANAFRNTGFQHVRYNYVWRKPVILEAFAQLQYNKPLRIDERWLLGGGPRVVFYDKEDLRLAVGMGLMLEYEVDRVNELEYFDLRNSNYISAALKLEPHLQLTLILYYQPNVSDFRDHRVSIESQLRLRVSRRFAVDTRLTLQNDTRMAPGIPELNYRWMNAFTILL